MYIKLVTRQDEPARVLPATGPASTRVKSKTRIPLNGVVLDGLVGRFGASPILMISIGGVALIAIA